MPALRVKEIDSIVELVKTLINDKEKEIKDNFKKDFNFEVDSPSSFLLINKLKEERAFLETTITPVHTELDKEIAEYLFPSNGVTFNFSHDRFIDNFPKVKSLIDSIDSIITQLENEGLKAVLTANPLFEEIGGSKKENYIRLIIKDVEDKFRLENGQKAVLGYDFVIDEVFRIYTEKYLIISTIVLPDSGSLSI